MEAVVHYAEADLPNEALYRSLQHPGRHQLEYPNPASSSAVLVDATANRARQRRSITGRQRQQQQQHQQEQQQQQNHQQLLQKEPRILRRRPSRRPPLDRSSISSTLLDAGAAGRREEQLDRLLRQFPRNRLRIVEKLGEGSFGMVSE